MERDEEKWGKIFELLGGKLYKKYFKIFYFKLIKKNYLLGWYIMLFRLGKLLR